MDVPPELAEALGGGSIGATRALRQLLSSNGVPLNVGAGDAELATRAQQQAWPDQVRDQVMKLCAMLLAALEQNSALQQQRGGGGQGGEPSARHRAHDFDGAHRCRHFARRAVEPTPPVETTTTPVTTPTTQTTPTTATTPATPTTTTPATPTTTTPATPPPPPTERTPPPPVQTGTTPATGGTGRTGLAATSVPYDQLPARMKGGVSPDNGMQRIIVRDEKELDMLPMWNGMHPDAANSYRQRLSDALKAEGGSVMGFAGYEVEVVGTNGKERSHAPAVTDTQIRDFVNANLNDPGKIAAAMKEHDVSFDRIGFAMGYSRKQIVDFVMATSNKDLIALL